MKTTRNKETLDGNNELEAKELFGDHLWDETFIKDPLDQRFKRPDTVGEGVVIVPASILLILFGKDLTIEAVNSLNQAIFQPNALGPVIQYGKVLVEATASALLYGLGALGVIYGLPRLGRD